MTSNFKIPSPTYYNVDVKCTGEPPIATYKFREQDVPPNVDTFFASICLRDVEIRGLKPTYKYNNFVCINVHY